MKISQTSRRQFIKRSAALASLSFLPSAAWARLQTGKVRTAHIGVGNMGLEDLKSTAAHSMVEVTALCDVDSRYLAEASKLFPKAKTFTDYRKLMDTMTGDVDAVIVSTPDHTHAPASMAAMEIGKPVYCQKPLTHYVSECRKVATIAQEKSLITQMGIQVHSFYEYRLAALMIRSGIIGKVHTVHAWSDKAWSYKKSEPKKGDPVPDYLDWNLWVGTAPERPYKDKIYHPGAWRRLIDYGCGTLGDMGVHIFDTPFHALNLGYPLNVRSDGPANNGFGYGKKNKVTYIFSGTEYTTDQLTWIWYDGKKAPEKHEDLQLPDKNLPDQGALFVGEKGSFLLPHFMQLPKLIVDGQYVDISKDISAFDDQLGARIPDYPTATKVHYHQFIDTVMGKAECSAPFSYAAKLSESILLGVIAERFPGETLNWDGERGQFKENAANAFVSGDYRTF